MNRVLEIIAIIVVLGLGGVMHFNDKIEGIFAPPPAESELVCVTLSGSRPTQVQRGPSRRSREFIVIDVGDGKQISVNGPKLEEMARALSTSERTFLYMAPEGTRHHRRLWRLVVNEGEGPSKEILSYSDCVAAEMRMSRLLYFMSYLLWGVCLTGVINLVLRFEQHSVQSNLLAISGFVIGAAVAFALHRDEPKELFAGSEGVHSSTPSASSAQRTFPFERIIVDKSGRSLEARILAVSGDSIRLERLSDGRVFVIPFSSLGDQDRIFFESLKE